MGLPVTTALCRVCGTSLAGIPYGTIDDARRPVHRQEALQCRRCGWRNLDPVTSDTLDLGLFRRSYPEVSLPPDGSNSVEDTVRALSWLRGAAVAALRGTVWSAPGVAHACLLEQLRALSALAGTAQTHLVLQLQQIYAALVVEGQFPVRSHVQWGPAAAQLLTGLTADIRALSAFLRELRSGGVVSVDFGTDALTLRYRTELQSVADVGANVSIGSDDFSVEALELVDEVERRVFKVSVLDLTRALWDRRQLEGHTLVEELDGLMAVRLEGDDFLVGALRDLMVLHHEGWRRANVPSFGYSSPQPEYRSAQGLVVTASEMDWLAYTPLLAFSNDDHDRVGLTSEVLVQRTFARATLSVASRLRAAQDMALELHGADLAREVAGTSRRAHEMLETRTASTAERQGFSTSQGLAELGGRSLECGEIDVLASGLGREGEIVVVVECKDIDSPLYRELGVEQVQTTLDGAVRQARRKAKWVERNWAQVADLLHRPHIEPLVVPLVVTRVVPFPTRDGICILPLGGFDRVLTMLRQEAVDAWWPVLRPHT
jgi:hypothetical protein